MNGSAALTPIPIERVGGFRFGHVTDLVGATGCTVIIAPGGAVAGVDVRGGAPASRETDLLRPENTVERIHAVCLSGGSAFGLEAASGEARELERRGIGLDVGPTVVPIVCSSCIFDLAFGDAAARPGVGDGIVAAKAALDGDGATPLAEGTVGAGTGATVGKLAGMDRAMKGGLGARAYQLGELQVGAIAAVNACGDVLDPDTGERIAGVRGEDGGLADTTEVLLGGFARMPLQRTNTTISCVVTNARLTKAQATKVAQMSADAYAHAISPTHTTNDGDTVFVMATGEVDAPVDVVGALATRALGRAIADGARSATSAYGYVAARDL